MAVTKENFLSVSTAAWEKAQKMDQFGYADISLAMQISVEQATRIVKGWIREGSVDQIHSGQAGAKRSLWRCKQDFVRIEPLRWRTPEENMWTHMRKACVFTPTDLAAHATTETVTVTPAEAADYCRVLLNAGYLKVQRRAAPSMKRDAIYRLVEITGVAPPVVKRVRALFDPNTGATIVLGGAA